jgi:FlaA1/EpsC-like NDP-sugar epimerase
MFIGNVFSSDLLVLLPSFFLIFTLLILTLYPVFSNYSSFSKFLIEDVLFKISFSLLLFIVLLLNQISFEWKAFNFYFS